MPKLGETQYYKATKNAIDTYITHPWGGNEFADPAYQHIGKDQYLTGLQSKINEANQFINKSSQPGYVPQVGATYTKNDVQGFQNQLNQALGEQGVYASNYIDKSVNVPGGSF